MPPLWYQFGTVVKRNVTDSVRSGQVTDDVIFANQPRRLNMTLLAKILAERGISANQLALKVGTTRQTISRLASGKMSMSKEWATKLAPFLGVDPTALLFEVSDAEVLPSSSVSSELGPYLRPVLVHMFQLAGFDRLKAEEWTEVAILTAEGAQAEGRVPADQEVSLLVTAFLKAQSADRRPKQ